MSVSPRAQRAARRHQVNETTSPSGFTGLTVLTLTTGNTVQTALNDDDVDFVGGGAGGFDEDIGVEGNVAEEVEEVLLPPLPPLKSVFDCTYVQPTQSGWECRQCGESFLGKHSTRRALKHVMKMSKNDVGVCQAVIPDNYLQ